MRLTVLASLFLFAGAAFAATREVVPIHSSTMANGDLRYSVTLKIGGTSVETQFDTGSVGLRVLPGVLKPQDAVAQGTPAAVQYGSGVRLNGTLALANVSLGNTSVRVPMQLVDSISCSDARPKCPASKAGAKDFLMGGNPLRGEGYKAILGVGMLRNPASNPLVAMGGRWLVVLPRPGQSTGELIINPTVAETRGFRTISLQRFAVKPGDVSAYWKDHGVQGCLKRLDSAQQVCGDSILDTGAAGFHIYADALQGNWPVGTPAHFSLAMADGSQLGQHFKVDNGGGRYVRYITAQGEHNFHGINAGLLTYFDNAVLYDQGAGVIGLKSR
ncbi:DUF3443 domain-containing protein [Pseudomonas sp. Xaverov 259]|uniref:DUF3443 domain-containing protein n=1 Tax=Pseudomonas sp. Xaverov 259 TaxID=2666086 RepID=UPI001C5AEE42|nr:DUF3443 domain-containing protein [Pseudomonas sp. Xaverov 259]